MTDGWKDRSAGLVLFGAFQILLGLGAVCMLFGLAAATELQSRNPGAPPTPVAALLASIVLYALLAFYFFAVGIGSIRKRRWARAISLVVSSMWLVIGVLSSATAAVVMPHLMTSFPASPMPVMVITFATLGVIYIVLPLILVLFYRSPHVKATCDARDPVPRWTDRVPLPILALVLLMAFSSVTVLACSAYGVAPVFGVVLTGAPAIIVFVAMAGLCAFIAVQLYRLKRSAWWTLVLFYVIGAVNGIYTFRVIDLEKLYEQMGLMSPQVRSMHLTDMYRDPSFWVLMGVCWVAMLAYVIWTRRFFDEPPPRTRTGDVAGG